MSYYYYVLIPLGLGLFFVLWKAIKVAFAGFLPSPLNKIPGPKPGSWWNGNWKEVADAQALDPHCRWVYDQFPDAPLIHYRLYLNTERVLVVDPESVKVVLNDNDTFTKNSTGYKELAKMIGKGLVSLLGDEHASQRKIINPTFKFHNLKAMSSVFVEQTKILMAKWENTPHNQTIPLMEDINKLTLNIIGLSALGFDFTAFSSDEHSIGHEASKRFSYIIGGFPTGYAVLMALFPALLHSPLSVYKRFKESLNYTNELVTALINTKRNSPNDGVKDLLDLLLDAVDEETGQKFTDEQLISHVKTFLFAGHETTATLITWAFYVLTQRPDVLDKIREELDRELGDKTVDFADIDKLVYLRAVIKETLRMYPPVAIVTRMTEKDVQLNGYTIPAGTEVSVSSYVLHHHPKYWDEPEVFKPERWLTNKSNNNKSEFVHPYVYIPFLKGPRNCIGERFAMMEATIVLSMLLKNFSFSMDPTAWNSAKRRLRVTMRVHPPLILPLQKRHSVESSQ